MTNGSTPRIVVIGGGISGLVAAWHLINAEPTWEVRVFESADRFGGKIRTDEFAGVLVDSGADAFLARVPDGVALCRELGIESGLVAPATSHALVWSRGELLRFPSDTVLGLPSNLDTLADTGLISPAGIARAREDSTLPASVGRTGEDPTVGELVADRLGSEIVDRLVNPLVGSINAGDVNLLSAASSAPQIAEIARTDTSLVAGAHRQLAERVSRSPAAPVFYAPADGMQVIVDALVAQLRARNVLLSTRTPVIALARRDQQWLVTTDDDVVSADAVIIATPAPYTADLLRPVAPVAATQLDGISYASVALIRLAYPVDATELNLDASGFVIPAVENTVLTACSWASSKWAALHSPQTLILRASAGRFGDNRAAEMSDEQLSEIAVAELADMMQLTKSPSAISVTRWPNSFPQYMAGHQARVGAIERDIAALDTVALAGAAYRGLGVPACIHSGRIAAQQIISSLK